MADVPAVIIPFLLLEADGLGQPLLVPANLPDQSSELASEICLGCSQLCLFRPRWPRTSEVVDRGPLARAKDPEAPPKDLVHLLERLPVCPLELGGGDRVVSLPGGEAERRSRRLQKHQAVDRLRNCDVVAVGAQRHGRRRAASVEERMQLAALVGDVVPPL